MPEPSAAARAEIDRDLLRYAYGLAGPRDCILNLLINGAVAWWVFREQENIPLTGTD